MPSTITRQSYVILGVDNKPVGASLPFATLYDPVARTVTIVGPEGPGKPWLTVDQSYKLVLPVPTEADSDIGGFRAIDRATLYPAQNRTFVFRAGAPTGETRIEPAVDYCADVMPIFFTKCNGSFCHGAGTSPAAGLILTTPEGIRTTAIGRVAQGANTTARPFSPEAPGRLFGVNMAIVEAGAPGSSWLIYKIELAPPPASQVPGRPPLLCFPDLVGAPPYPAPCADYHPSSPAHEYADDIDRTILSDFVLGRQMPYPGTEQIYPYEPLTFQERQRVRMWITQGAQVRECGGCTEVSKGIPGAL